MAVVLVAVCTSQQRAHAAPPLPGARVVGDQAGKALMAACSQVAGAVERMKTSPHQGWGVAEVMQVGGGEQHVSIGRRLDRRQSRRPMSGTRRAVTAVGHTGSIAKGP